MLIFSQDDVLVSTSFWESLSNVAHSPEKCGHFLDQILMNASFGQMGSGGLPRPKAAQKVEKAISNYSESVKNGIYVIFRF